MRFEGLETINAPRSKVWAFITDPAAVCQCVPGFKSLEVIRPVYQFKVMASISMGTLQVDFTVSVTYDLLTEPSLANFQAVATASGGNGEARVNSHVVLADGENNSTRLAWVVNMTVLGMIAALADRLGSGLSKQLTTAFFACVRKKIES